MSDATGKSKAAANHEVTQVEVDYRGGRVLLVGAAPAIIALVALLGMVLVAVLVVRLAGRAIDRIDGHAPASKASPVVDGGPPSSIDK